MIWNKQTILNSYPRDLGSVLRKVCKSHIFAEYRCILILMTHFVSTLQPVIWHHLRGRHLFFSVANWKNGQESLYHLRVVNQHQICFGYLLIPGRARCKIDFCPTVHRTLHVELRDRHLKFSMANWKNGRPSFDLFRKVIKVRPSLRWLLTPRKSGARVTSERFDLEWPS